VLGELDAITRDARAGRRPNEHLLWLGHDANSLCVEWTEERRELDLVVGEDGLETAPRRFTTDVEALARALDEAWGTIARFESVLTRMLATDGRLKGVTVLQRTDDASSA
jgi:hypothetical protein